MEPCTHCECYEKDGFCHLCDEMTEKFQNDSRASLLRSVTEAKANPKKLKALHAGLVEIEKIVDQYFAERLDVDSNDIMTLAIVARFFVRDYFDAAPPDIRSLPWLFISIGMRIGKLEAKAKIQ